MNETKQLFCNCLYYSSGAFFRSMNRLAETAFKPTGFAPSHAFTLMAVNRQPGLTASDLADIMQMSPSTVTRFVDKLEHQFFVERIIEGRHSRAYPTQRGEAVFPVLESAWKELFETINRRLDPKISDQLARSMTQATQHLELNPRETS